MHRLELARVTKQTRNFNFLLIGCDNNYLLIYNLIYKVNNADGNKLLLVANTAEIIMLYKVNYEGNYQDIIEYAID